MYMKITLVALLSQGASCSSGEKPESGRESIEHAILRKPKFTRGISVIVRSPEVEDFRVILAKKPEEKKEVDALVDSVVRLALSPRTPIRPPPGSPRPTIGGLFVQSPSTDEEIDNEGIYVPWYFTGDPKPKYGPIPRSPGEGGEDL